jgi:23S rRNA G2445 N2-methylase RlmL
MRKGKPIYIAHTQVGFEQIVARQLEREFEGIIIRDTRAIADKNGMLLFTYDGDISDLFELRTIEDLFVQVLVRTDIPPVYAGLKTLTEAVANIPIEQALTLARQIKPNRGGRGKLRYRVVARQANQASYRRIDAQQAVEKGIALRQDHKWQLAEEGAIEFWLNLLPDEVSIALRLSDEQMRRNDQKREQIAASLRPSAAAAMIWLTRPKPNDVFLDPMCGAGTLLIERGEAGRYKQLLGGDIREEAVAATLANVGPRYKPIEVQEWDATRLPLEDASANAAAVNLPFGKQIGSVEDNRTLYPAFLTEMLRVLRPAARFVVLTGDTRTFEYVLKRTRGFVEYESYPVQLLGQRARVYVLERQ